MNRNYDAQEKWHYRTSRRKKSNWIGVCLIGVAVIAMVVGIQSILHANLVVSGHDIVESQSNAVVTPDIVEESYPQEIVQESEQEDTAASQITLRQNPITDQEAQELTDLLDSMPGNISVWIQDIATGQTYTYQAEYSYYSASILKAPYALWLSQRDQAGEIDLNTLVSYKSGWERVYSMIANSDNDAAYLLSKQWPSTEETGFSSFLSTIGVANPTGCEVTPEGIHGYLTAEDGGAIMTALYNYFETDTANAQQLQQAFLDASHNLLWLPDTAAKKYGSWDMALHDMAIVYTDNPYIIVAFSDWGDTDVDFPTEGTARMQQIGTLVAEIMEE